MDVVFRITPQSDLFRCEQAHTASATGTWRLCLELFRVRAIAAHRAGSKWRVGAVQQNSLRHRG